MTCQLDDVLATLQGTDVNFEIIKSQTVRPLKLFYTHNKANILRGYIFAQNTLKDKRFYSEINADSYYKLGPHVAYSASLLGEKIKRQLQEKDALGIDEVEVFSDLSKAETIKKIQSIKESSIAIATEKNCNVGHVFVTVGFRL